MDDLALRSPHHELLEGCLTAASERWQGKLLLAEINACSTTRNLERGQRVHAEAVRCGQESNTYVVRALVNMYAKCGSMVDARQLFDKAKHPDLVSWNIVILGYADNGQEHTALDLFTRMRCRGPAPDSVTFLAALKACTTLALTGPSCRHWGKLIHDLAIEETFDSNVKVQSTLIDLYAKSGSMVRARQEFDSMGHPSVVSWNVLILGYAENGQELVALDMFTRMHSEGFLPSCSTVMAALKACSSLVAKGQWAECRERCDEIQRLAKKNGFGSDMFVQSSLIDMYAKSGSMADASQVFEAMDHPNVVAWTALILGYAENGQGLNALDLFTRMRTEGPAPNSVTFTAVLKACALVGGLEFGRTIHLELDRASSSSLDVIVVTCLVDFYAKCGSLDEARSVFDSHPEARDTITWTALLTGFSSCGDHGSAFQLFEGLQRAGLFPNSATFLCLLACCSRAGLVQKGRECFDAMSTKYGIVPTVEHHTCIVDLLGRSNKLEDAMALLQTMACSPDDVAWRTILAACRKWRNAELGKLAFQSLVDRDMAAHALMGQIYGSRGRLREQEMVVAMRRVLQLPIKPGEACWTNKSGEVHSFVT